VEQVKGGRRRPPGQESWADAVSGAILVAVDSARVGDLGDGTLDCRDVLGDPEGEDTVHDVDAVTAPHLADVAQDGLADRPQLAA